MEHAVESIIANCRGFGQVLHLARTAAASSCAILITGESGTGKELVARTIHDHSPHKAGRYYPVNVAALPCDLVESHLFGHVSGAFTGAIHNRAGAFRKADGGTLLLDEIGDLPSGAQPKLLRALEQKEIQPVGSDETIAVDTRVIAATSQDLEKMVESGQFRKDLLYRLNVVEIHIPPLRERPEDIPALAEYYCIRHARANEKPVKRLNADACLQLLNHPWNGNVRELSNMIERAVLFCQSDTIGPEDLNLSGCHESIYSPTTTLQEAVDIFKKQHIISVLQRAKGNRNGAAEILGVSQATLFRYIDKYDLKGYALHKRNDSPSQT
ncbi:regulatory Fis family protein [Thiogranum longum]|uniref:Regulatory Fis family protein n=1 Tax=Thiogranum longum TaxID=1537524 RepID=A0A4R1HGS5_9GAMM|nr:sigma 54-interacting transcriptional regulator [Thiogranum longum]TCK19490.1 regulatory Fis family protein [Thiogranum longum]